MNEIKLVSETNEVEYRDVLKVTKFFSACSNSNERNGVDLNFLNASTVRDSSK